MKHDITITYSYIDGKRATGRLNFIGDGMVIPVISGPYGKGYAPLGEYSSTAYSGPKEIETVANAEAYAQYGVGFFIPIFPKFETDRFGLGIHPDGKILGSLGCIACHFESRQQVLYAYNMLANFIKYNDEMSILITQ